MQGDIEVLTRLFAKRVLDLMAWKQTAEYSPSRRDAELGAQRFLR